MSSINPELFEIFKRNFQLAYTPVGTPVCSFARLPLDEIEALRALPARPRPWRCDDCAQLVFGTFPNYRPRHTNHSVCSECAAKYRNCLACGEESLNRVCAGCLYECMFKENFPQRLSPRQRVWFTIINNFSIFDNHGSVTQIARRAKTNCPTVKKLIERAGEMLERKMCADGVVRYRLQLKSSRLS